MAKKTEMTYEKAMEQLEQIVRSVENNELDIDHLSEKPIVPYTTSCHGSRPAASKASITASLLKGKKLPARKAATSIPQ